MAAEWMPRPPDAFSSLSTRPKRQEPDWEWQSPERSRSCTGAICPYPVGRVRGPESPSACHSMTVLGLEPRAGRRSLLALSQETGAGRPTRRPCQMAALSFKLLGRRHGFTLIRYANTCG